MNRLAILSVMAVMAVVLMGCGSDPQTGTGGGAGGGFNGAGGGGGGGGSSASCGSQNCTGCCFNGTCQPGSTAAGCGKAGASCSVCTTNQICRVDQTCGVDPESTWLVQPTSARIAPNNNGSAWDGDGSAPDPKVFMTCGDMTAATSTPEAPDTYQPTWSTGACSAKAKDLLRAGWTFQVYDIDAFSDDSITASLRVTLTEADFAAAGFTLQPSGGLQAMTVTMRRQ